VSPFWRWRFLASRGGLSKWRAYEHAARPSRVVRLLDRVLVVVDFVTRPFLMFDHALPESGAILSRPS